VALCGMSGGSMDCYIMTNQAQVHILKSEYAEARNIHIQMLQMISMDPESYNYGLTLLNLAEIDVSMGASMEDVQRNSNAARKIFSTMGVVQSVTMCDVITADLYLREGNIMEAKMLFEKSIKSSSGNLATMSYCLECLGDVSRWGAFNWMTSWTVVFLAHSHKFKEKLGVYKALQFLGNVFLTYDDQDTAISLFDVALEGFTHMDVHRSRAECMARLADISGAYGDPFKAVELWSMARLLFERSSQRKQVTHIDERLASVGQDVQKQYTVNLTCLAELNAHSEPVEKSEDELSDIEDLMNVVEKENVLVVI
jgi:tetratricopeptide (TPR) repeat protein